MAGQSIERREVLRVLALAAAASEFPGFSRWALACGHGESATPRPRPDHYTPQFFTGPEYATVERLCDIILPRDGSPGAADAGVSEFIDFMVASDPSIQYKFRYGLSWLDAQADRLYGRPFVKLETAEQTNILDHLAYKDKFRPGEDEGRDFFKLVRDYTMMGFYTSKAGLQELDYPGLQVFYSSTPRCPHHDDPEHRHLSSGVRGWGRDWGQV
jgi:gluconate 2-dehydrogenase gamma chain